jgi:50S ribosomal protein L16 3-hydroxylase
MGPCVTCSVGFRAPSQRELAASFFARLVDSLDPRERYGDPDLTPQDDPGRIAPEVLSRVREALSAGLRDEAFLRDWFGRFVTVAHRESAEPVRVPRPSEAELIRALERGAVLRRLAPSCFAHADVGRGRRVLFVGGRAERLGPDSAFAAPLLCGRGRLDRRALGRILDRPPLVRLLAGVVARGYLILDSNDPLPR